MKKKDQPGDAALRARAELLYNRPKKKEQGPPFDVDLKRLVHELEVHQIELELQNDELIQTRGKLEDLLAQYTDLYEFAPLGYFNLSTEGRIMRVNLHGATLLNMERSYLLNTNFGNFLSPESRSGFKTFLADIFNSASRVMTELTLVRKDRKALICEVNAQSMPNGQECRLIILDITPRKKAEQVLAESNNLLEKLVQERTADLQTALQTKDEFLRMITHELRTPLSGILGLTEALQMPGYGGLTERQLNALLNIEANSQRLLSLINDVIDYTLLLSRSIEMAPRKCSLDSICEDALHAIEPVALKKHQQAKYHADPSGLIITVDEKSLSKILHILLKNASKFTGEGGELGIKSHADPITKRINITVWDTGIGIAVENQSRIFQPFTQVDARLSRQYEGTGLSLAIVWQLIGLLEGQISIESEPGKGSRFIITLPLGSSG